jgi:hypothetical protein
MFSSDSAIVMILGVLISLGFIVGTVHYINKIISANTQDLLVKFILIVFAALVGVFIVDKVVAFKINLLSESQNDSLFDLIKTLTLMIFSFYFGTQKGKSD